MSTLRFRITQEMVDRFAALIGDRSSLHVDSAFARRSPFRRRVVHGMLPVMYLSRCEELRSEERGHCIAGLSVRFHRPAFPGEELALTVSEPSVSSSEPDEVQVERALEYVITRGGSGETVTEGTIRLTAEECAGTGGQAETRTDGAATSVVPERLEERVAVFDDLAKGEVASFPIQIADEQVRALRGLMASGRSSGEHLDPSDTLERGLLAAACSSTYVGMCMPGRFATYTELTFSSPGWPAGDVRATFSGEIAFLSASTQTAVAQFTVTSANAGDPLAQGRIKARVSDPPQAMPTMEQIRKDGTDLGLRNRVVLVTGASRGIGETVAKLFGAHGARVVVIYYRGREDAERVAREIIEAGGEAVPVGADVSEVADVDELVAAATRQLGPIEILINNAVGSYEERAFHNLRWRDVQRDLDVIVRGAFNCCQAVLPGMRERAYGRIVNLSTSAVEDPPGGHAGYVMAKSALVGLTRSLAVEYASDGIRVNAVMPGMVATDLTSNISSMAREAIRQDTPMKRLASPLDVARAVVYLASDWSSFTTGQQFAVTGGRPPFF